jgi:hypothetical protein
MSKRKAIEANDESKGQRRRLCSLADLLTNAHAEPSLNGFVYELLSHESNSIRVFTIYPNSSDARIRCIMQEEQLSVANYTCLLYTWQPSYPQHTIEVNGRPLSVGDNLYQFLHAYRATQTQEVLIN